MSDWSVDLNGVTLGCDDPEALGTLSFPPDGLGVPELRTEDVTYPQRDGVKHFKDWYEPRIITLEEVTVCSDDCTDCASARSKMQQISKAWSRQCEDVELVIHTDCEPETRINFSIDPEVQRAGAADAVVANLFPNPFLIDGTGVLVQNRPVSQTAGVAGGGPLVRGVEVPYRTITPVDGSTGTILVTLNYSTVNVPVEPGQDLHLSVLVRADGGQVQVRPRVEWRGALNVAVGQWSSPVQTTVGENWVAVTGDVVVPDNAAGAKIQLDVDDLVQPEAFHLTGALATTDGYDGEVFSGSSPDADGFDFTWTGTANNSVSTAVGTPPLEWPTGVVLTEQGGLIVGDAGNPDVDAPDGTPWTAYLLGGGTVSGTICGVPPEWPSTGVITRLMVGDGPYFDGSFPDTDDFDYEWGGVPFESISLENDIVDRAVTGPFGVVGRPRVATTTWARGVDCATMLLRFDGADHRMYILDGSGLPGSGVVHARVDPTREAFSRCYPRCYTEGGEPGQPDTLARTNLHPNPLVGDNAVGWTLGGRGGVTQTVETDSGPTVNGQDLPWRGLSFSTGTGTPTVYTNGDGTPQFSVTAGQSLDVSAYVLSEGVRTTLGIQTDGGTVWGEEFFPGGGWTKLSDVLIPPAGATTGRLLVQFNADDIDNNIGITLGITGVLVGVAGEPFDGDTPDNTEFRYEWVGDPYQSSSQEWRLGSPDTGGSYCYDVETGEGVGPTTVVNIGTECASPIICFHGSLTDPVLENITTGETVGVFGFIAGGADPICVDTQDMSASQGGQSRTHLITGNIGMSLEPGENELRLTSFSTSDSGYVTIEFRPSVVSA